jgi:hypothetical protein
MLPGLNLSLLDSNEIDSERTLARLVEEYRTTRKQIRIPGVSMYETTKARTAEASLSLAEKRPSSDALGLVTGDRGHGDEVELRVPQLTAI